MIISDSTLLIHFALPTAGADDVARAKKVYAQDPDWRVTALWKSEVRHVGIKYVRSGALLRGDLIVALHLLDGMLASKTEVVTHVEALDAAFRYELSGYDAEYAALAERLGVPLVTSDKRVLHSVECAVSPGTFADAAPR